MKLNQILFSALLIGAPGLSFAVGAIAVDDHAGQDQPGYGFSYGYNNKEEAMSRALRECRKQGNPKCKVMVWFKDCGAYAASANFYGIGWGATTEIAERKALQHCSKRSCEIKVSQCDDE